MRAGIFALETANPPCIELEAYFIRSVNERARRELGTWPSADVLVDRLADALTEDAADAEQDPQRKSKLRTAADAVAGFARDVAVGVVSGQLGG